MSADARTRTPRPVPELTAKQVKLIEPAARAHAAYADSIAEWDALLPQRREAARAAVAGRVSKRRIAQRLGISATAVGNIVLEPTEEYVIHKELTPEQEQLLAEVERIHKRMIEIEASWPDLRRARRVAFKALVKSGLNMARIARELPVSPTTVGNVVKNGR